MCNKEQGFYQSARSGQNRMLEQRPALLTNEALVDAAIKRLTGPTMKQQLQALQKRGK